MIRCQKKVIYNIWCCYLVFVEVIYISFHLEKYIYTHAQKRLWILLASCCTSKFTISGWLSNVQVLSGYPTSYRCLSHYILAFTLQPYFAGHISHNSYSLLYPMLSWVVRCHDDVAMTRLSSLPHKPTYALFTRGAYTGFSPLHISKPSPPWKQRRSKAAPRRDPDGGWDPLNPHLFWIFTWHVNFLFFFSFASNVLNLFLGAVTRIGFLPKVGVSSDSCSCQPQGLIPAFNQTLFYHNLFKAFR